MNKVLWSIKNTEEGQVILRTDENGTVWWIPEEPGNRHYEEYLAWIAEGNTPEVIND